MEHCGMTDSGKLFRVDARKRKVIVPPANKVIGTVGEHLSEVVTFQIPKSIDGHDIKGCAEHYLTWTNSNGDEGHDNLELVSEDAEWLYYTWKIRGNTTVKEGIVSFSLHFEDYSEDGTLDYRWGTTPCKDCEILEGLNAAVAAYQAIYVVGDTLIFDDYTPVRDNTMVLESAVIPCKTVHVTIKHIQQEGDSTTVTYQYLDENGRLQERSVELYTGITEFDAIAGTHLTFSFLTYGEKLNFSINGQLCNVLTDVDGTGGYLTYTMSPQPDFDEFEMRTLVEWEEGTTA